MQGRVTVVGEAVVDLMPDPGRPGSYTAHPGGSPYNVAIGLARLGCTTSLLARLSDTAFGRFLRDHAAEEGVELGHAPLATEPTTLAVVSLDPQGTAAYDLYVAGASDWQWTASELVLPAGTEVLHMGSLASWTAPGDALIHDLAALARAQGVLVSYDPNVRPELQPDRAAAAASVARSVAVAHLVKASVDDLAWLHPDRSPAQVAHDWLDLGAAVVVVTEGPAGATAYWAGDLVHRPAQATTVLDTVGAGDAFTSGLLDALVRRGLHQPAALHGAPLADLLDDALLVAASACARIGADPPRRTSPRSARPLTARDL